MTQETAEALIQTLAINFSALYEAQCQLAALEKTFSFQPSWNLMYRANLEAVRRETRPLLSHEELASLLAGLRRP
jgi:hypothetical protein